MKTKAKVISIEEWKKSKENHNNDTITIEGKGSVTITGEYPEGFFDISSPVFFEDGFIFDDN